jgi:hypothetical protein
LQDGHSYPISPGSFWAGAMRTTSSIGALQCGQEIVSSFCGRLATERDPATVLRERLLSSLVSIGVVGIHGQPWPEVRASGGGQLRTLNRLRAVWSVSDRGTAGAFSREKCPCFQFARLLRSRPPACAAPCSCHHEACSARRTAEQRDERAAPDHSITLSARTSRPLQPI